MLTDTRLRHLKPKEKLYKVNDRDGLYVAVTPAGTISFRYNYSINGRQETVTFGRYGVGGITLAEARERLNEANDSVMIYDSLSNRSSLLRLKKRGHTVINTSCNESDEIESVTFSQLVSLKTQHGDLLLLDVREPAERNVISIGGMHIPLRDLPTRIADLPEDQLIVCYCKSGSRSKRAILFLQDQGFTRIVNLRGGIMGLTQTEKQNLREWGEQYES